MFYKISNGRILCSKNTGNIYVADLYVIELNKDYSNISLPEMVKIISKNNKKYDIGNMNFYKKIILKFFDVLCKHLLKSEVECHKIISEKIKNFDYKITIIQ